MIFVCPQYAITYLEGCQLTVGDGARAGTRWRGTPVSVAHWDIWREDNRCDNETLLCGTYNVYICSSVGNGQIFAIVREAECIYAISRMHFIKLKRMTQKAG